MVMRGNWRGRRWHRRGARTTAGAAGVDNDDVAHIMSHNLSQKSGHHQQHFFTYTYIFIYWISVVEHRKYFEAILRFFGSFSLLVLPVCGDCGGVMNKARDDDVCQCVSVYVCVCVCVCDVGS